MAVQILSPTQGQEAHGCSPTTAFHGVIEAVINPDSPTALVLRAPNARLHTVLVETGGTMINRHNAASRLMEIGIGNPIQLDVQHREGRQHTSWAALAITKEIA